MKIIFKLSTKAKSVHKRKLALLAGMPILAEIVSIGLYTIASRSLNWYIIVSRVARNYLTGPKVLGSLYISDSIIKTVISEVYQINFYYYIDLTFNY